MASNINSISTATTHLNVNDPQDPIEINATTPQQNTTSEQGEQAEKIKNITHRFLFQQIVNSMRTMTQYHLQELQKQQAEEDQASCTR